MSEDLRRFLREALPHLTNRPLPPVDAPAVREGLQMGIDPNLSTITTFRDALGVAMALADDFAFANVAMVLGPEGAIVDAVMTDGIGGTLEPVIGRITGDTQRPPTVEDGAAAVVLFSVRPFEPDVLREADLKIFRNAAWRLAWIGAQLLDWIETDGDLFRSFAYITRPAQAWPQDPPAERRQLEWPG